MVKVSPILVPLGTVTKCVVFFCERLLSSPLNCYDVTLFGSIGSSSSTMLLLYGYHWFIALVYSLLWNEISLLLLFAFLTGFMAVVWVEGGSMAYV